MLEKFIIDMYLPKTIIKWLDINDAKALFFQYLAVGILIFETLLEILVSNRLVSRNALYKISRGFMLNVIKFVPMLIVIVFCDPVIRQLFPSDMRVDLNNGIGKEVAGGFVALFIIEFALLLFLVVLPNLLWFLHAGINILIKGESKTFKIDADSKAVVGTILTQFQDVMVMVALILNAVVLYYNYCM